MEDKIMSKFIAQALMKVSKNTVNSSGCCVWYQPPEPKNLKLKKAVCKKDEYKHGS